MTSDAPEFPYMVLPNTLFPYYFQLGTQL